MDVLIGQLATGLSLGSILLLAALGLSLTFGQLGVINMAHGEFIMAGCYTAYVVQQLISSAGASLLISLVVGFFVGGAMGALLEVTLIQRMYHRPLDTLLVTFGVGLILQQLARDIFGAPAVNVVVPEWLAGGVEIFGAVVPKTSRASCWSTSDTPHVTSSVSSGRWYIRRSSAASSSTPSTPATRTTEVTAGEMPRRWR